MRSYSGAIIYTAVGRDEYLVNQRREGVLEWAQTLHETEEGSARLNK